MSCRTVPLGRSGLVALVDDEDYERVSAYKWHLDGNGYAVRPNDKNASPLMVLMHRELLGLSGAQRADHANGNRVDNRRANLRLCTRGENRRNSRVARGRRFKGVRQISAQSWRARLKIEGRNIHLGCFASEIEAARAYDAAARKYFGAFACLNDPEPGERSAVGA